MASTSNNLRVEPAQESDLPRLMQILLPRFQHLDFMQLTGATATPSGITLMSHQHALAWREHAQNNFQTPMGIKCIHTNPTTGVETIIATATWAIFSHPRTQEQFTHPFHLVRADWVPDADKRSLAREWTAKSIATRIRWWGGTPHGELYFMATDPGFEGLGAGTKCVEWGLERCRELGIPAWLESSPRGRGMYERCGFVVAEERGGDGRDGGRGLPMVWWPEGWEEERGPVLPGWGMQEGG